MKKLAMTLLAFVLSLTCISGILAASAETSEIQEVKETTTGSVAEPQKWTVSKEYFALSYTMTVEANPGKVGDNGCCGINLGGTPDDADCFACVYIPFEGGLQGKTPAFDKKLRFGPWWSDKNGGKYKKDFVMSEQEWIGKEATIVVLCSQKDGKLTVDSIYLNGTKQDFDSCTLDEFNGKVGYATKLSGVEYTAKFVESDEKLDEKCFDAKPAPVDPADPDPGKKPATTPDTPPKTGTASVVIASVAVISLAGVVIASKKRNQDD